MKRKLAGSRAEARWQKRGLTQEAAFTLIELLVVIAVIAILAALLVPALSRAKEAGRTAACMSNVHQISLALQMYVQDNRCYPGFGRTPGQPKFWPEMLRTYASQGWTNQLYRCPSFKGPIWSNPSFQDGADLLGAYGYNDWDSYGDGHDVTFSLGSFTDSMPTQDPRHIVAVPPVRETEVAVPSEMIALGDSNYSPVNNTDGFLPLPKKYTVAGIGGLNKAQCYFHEFPHDSQLQALRLVEQRHSGKYNVAFCDGHAEKISHLRLYDGSDISLRRWNRDHEPHP